MSQLSPYLFNCRFKLEDTSCYTNSVDESGKDAIEKPEKGVSDIHLILDFQDSKLNRLKTEIPEYAVCSLLDSVIDVS
jgi:hypothetical protein